MRGRSIPPYVRTGVLTRIINWRVSASFDYGHEVLKIVYFRSYGLKNKQRTIIEGTFADVHYVTIQIDGLNPTLNTLKEDSPIELLYIL